MNDLSYIIKNRISLPEWIRKDVRLIKKGKHWQGLCPFHLEKTPSFSVHEQRFYCFGCRASGDIFEYVMQKRGIPFREALEELARYANIPIPEKEKPYKNLMFVMKKIQDYYHESLFNNTNALSYLSDRQINESSIKDFSIGFGASLKSFSVQDMKNLGFLTEFGFERFAERLMFPIWDSYGQAVGFSGRLLSDDKNAPKYYNTPETEFFKKKTLLYAYHIAKKFIHKDSPFILVEGYFDVIRMHQFGIKSAIGTMGTALSEENIQKLWKFQSVPVLCFDGDKAGLAAAYKTIEKVIPFLSGRKTLHFYLLPEKEDPDTFLQKYGKEGFFSLKKHHLIDVLWNFVVENHKIKQDSSPEEKSFFESSWKDLLTPIQDASLKRFYGQEFFKRQTNFLRKNIKKTMATYVPPIKNLDMRILLVTIINHPNILDDVFEALSSVDSQDLEIERIKMDILNKCEVIDDRPLFTETVYKWASFAHSDKSDEEALRGWTQVWMRLIKKKAEDVDLAYTCVKTKCDAESWENFKKIKKLYTQKEKW
jgi:DNA primase